MRNIAICVISAGHLDCVILYFLVIYSVKFSSQGILSISLCERGSP